MADRTPQEYAVTGVEVQHHGAGEREKRRQIDDEWKEPHAHDSCQQQVHARESEPVVQDVDLHRQGQGHHGRQRIDRAEERDLRILPEDVAAAVPWIPERQLAIFEAVLQNRAVVEQVLDGETVRSHRQCGAS
jgi:hypothetical protein